jgi:hypothetical protein
MRRKIEVLGFETVAKNREDFEADAKVVNEREVLLHTLEDRMEVALLGLVGMQKSMARCVQDTNARILTLAPMVQDVEESISEGFLMIEERITKLEKAEVEDLVTCEEVHNMRQRLSEELNTKISGFEKELQTGLTHLAQLGLTEVKTTRSACVSFGAFNTSERDVGAGDHDF